jgi:hypothetical protein
MKRKLTLPRVACSVNGIASSFIRERNKFEEDITPCSALRVNRQVNQETNMKQAANEAPGKPRVLLAACFMLVSCFVYFLKLQIRWTFTPKRRFMLVSCFVYFLKLKIGGTFTPKRRLTFNGLYDFTCHKIVLFITAAVGISIPTKFNYFSRFRRTPWIVNPISLCHRLLLAYSKAPIIINFVTHGHILV